MGTDGSRIALLESERDSSHALWNFTFVFLSMRQVNPLIMGIATASFLLLRITQGSLTVFFFTSALFVDRLTVCKLLAYLLLSGTVTRREPRVSNQVSNA